MLEKGFSSNAFLLYDKFTNSQNNINQNVQFVLSLYFLKKNSRASIYKFFFKPLENSLKILPGLDIFGPLLEILKFLIVEAMKK